MANVNRLKQVRMAIVNFEENFHYKHIFSITEVLSNGRSYTYGADWADEQLHVEDILHHHRNDNECGTCACIVGFCVALQPAQIRNEIANSETPYEFATEWLGLSKAEAYWLFEPEPGAYEDFTHTILSYHESGETKHLAQYEYDESFQGYSYSSREAGYHEALRRIDYLIEYYGNANSN